MAGRNISVVIEQHAHDLRLAPINHPHERGLPVFRFGFAGEAFGERSVVRFGVARQDISDAFEPVIIELEIYKLTRHDGKPPIHIERLGWVHPPQRRRVGRGDAEG